MAEQGVDDFETLARRYWSAWGDTVRSTTATPTVPGWNEAMAWWTQLAQGGGGPADEAVGRFNAQAQGWFGQMQQLAARFAGQPASAADIASAWKHALGGDGANPFASMLSGFPGSDQGDASQWVERLMPWLRASHGGREWLDLPAFGFAREHQERWQQLARAQRDLHEQSQAYQTLLAQAGQDAFVRFEQKLAQHSQPGRQLGSVRALFDLWIDAAEEAYADVALSPRFRDAYAALVNAQMHLRGSVQREVEHAGAALGMPTRTELDSAHRKIVQLERELRRLRDAVQALSDRGPVGAPAPEPAAKAAPRKAEAAAKQPAARKAAPKKAALKKAVPKKAATTQKKGKR